VRVKPSQISRLASCNLATDDSGRAVSRNQYYQTFYQANCSAVSNILLIYGLDKDEKVYKQVYSRKSEWLDKKKLIYILTFADSICFSSVNPRTRKLFQETRTPNGVSATRRDICSRCIFYRVRYILGKGIQAGIQVHVDHLDILCLPEVMGLVGSWYREILRSKPQLLEIYKCHKISM
jgi:hypothetical protein